MATHSHVKVRKIGFNKRCHHLKMWLTDSYISSLLISIKNCEQNYNWLVKETKFRAPLKPISISQIICYLHFVFSRQQYFCTAVANFPAVNRSKNKLREIGTQTDFNLQQTRMGASLMKSANKLIFFPEVLRDFSKNYSGWTKLWAASHGCWFHRTENWINCSRITIERTTSTWSSVNR